jgi:hypothetical protein
LSRYFLMVAVAAAFVVPLLTARLVRLRGTPRQVIAFSLAALVAIAAAVIVGLAAIVDPGSLSINDLPVVVGRCIDAAGEILDHPVSHWPQIVAAVLLVAALARLMWSATLTFRDAASRARIVEAIRGHAGPAPAADPGLLVVPADRPFAFTVGLVRRRVVVSEPVLTELGEPERQAVLAHERAHARSGHAALLTAGAIVARAFPFVPPLRMLTEQLLAGLEMAADESAARVVGDPLVVARTILRLAPDAPRATIGLGVGIAAVGWRVERLIASSRVAGRRRRMLAGFVVASVFAIASGLILALPRSATALGAGERAMVVHAVCHLPHAG